MLLSDDNIRRYIRALYPVAFLLIMVPLVDMSLRIYPLQFGSLQWRFGAIGVLLGQFGTVLLGVGLAGLVAAFNGHTALLRGIGYATLTAGAITLALLALFALDAVQMRTLASAASKHVITISALGALFAGLVGTFALIAIGRGALAASRRVSAAARRPRAATSPLVVAGQSVSEG